MKQMAHWPNRKMFGDFTLFLLLLMCYAYTLPRWSDPNQNSRLELVRVWFFRLLLLTGMAGFAMLVWRRNWCATPLWIAIGANVLSAALINARERYRMPVDGYLALLASLFVCWLWTWLRAKCRSAKVHVPPLESCVHG